VGQWLDTWLADYLGDVKPGTIANYSQHVRTHIKPALGSVKLKALQPTAIQRMYNDKLKGGLSPKTIRNMHGAFHRSLETAVRLGFIPRNPSSACTLPRAEDKEIQPLDTPDIQKFLTAIKGHSLEAIYRLSMYGGLRSGELLGLTWDCIDFDKGTIYLYRQLLQPRVKGGNYKFGPLKNDKPRTINPAPSVIQTLKAHRIAQLEQRMRIGNLWNDGGFPDLVFTNESGGHLTQPGIWKAMQKLLAAAGLPHHRVHDLRHTYAVNSLRAGDDIKTVQENLGHHTAAFTLDKYAHVTDTMRRESALRMEAFINSLER